MSGSYKRVKEGCFRGQERVRRGQMDDMRREREEQELVREVLRMARRRS
jgi:hypothetical protein